MGQMLHALVIILASSGLMSTSLDKPGPASGLIAQSKASKHCGGSEVASKEWASKIREAARKAFPALRFKPKSDTCICHGSSCRIKHVYFVPEKLIVSVPDSKIEFKVSSIGTHVEGRFVLKPFGSDEEVREISETIRSSALTKRAFSGKKLYCLAVGQLNSARFACSPKPFGEYDNALVFSREAREFVVFIQGLDIEDESYHMAPVVTEYCLPLSKVDLGAIGWRIARSHPDVRNFIAKTAKPVIELLHKQRHFLILRDANKDPSVGLTVEFMQKKSFANPPSEIHSVFQGTEITPLKP
jgi:hypothetical protein